jgi:catechol-2,3-dioxygenase
MADDPDTMIGHASQNGTAQRGGARQTVALSHHLRDPDGNHVEFMNYR